MNINDLLHKVGTLITRHAGSKPADASTDTNVASIFKERNLKTIIRPPVKVHTFKTNSSHLKRHRAKINQPYSSQYDFIKQKLGANIVECGGGGDCFIYAFMRQLDRFRKLPKKEFDECKFEEMKKIRQTASKHAQNKNDKYKLELEGKIQAKQILLEKSASNDEREKYRLEIRQLNVLLEDAKKDDAAIRDLRKVHQTLDACGREIYYLLEFYNCHAAIFSEHDPQSNDGTIGCFCLYLPNGEMEMRRYSGPTDIPPNSKLIYHSGNDKYGHYQQIQSNLIQVLGS